MKHLVLSATTLAQYPVHVEFDDQGNVLTLEMPYWSNFHAHLRDKEMMEQLSKAIMGHVYYLLVMPNTGPIDTIRKVINYYKRLVKLAAKHGLTPRLIMTLYFTDKLTPAIIEKLAELPFPVGIKYYPPVKGATTGSGLGIPLYSPVAQEILCAMAEYKIPLLGHFESVYTKDGRQLPMIAREAYFMDHEFRPFRDQNPDLRVNIEHATTKEAIAIVREDTSGNTACGLTPQGLLFEREDLYHYTWGHTLNCMPTPKMPEDRFECLSFAASGDPRAHAGDDTAGHPFKTKRRPLAEAACGAWVPHALPLYVDAFRQADSLRGDSFVKFMCLNGANWWGLELPDPKKRLRLVRDTEHGMPDPVVLPKQNDFVVPLGWTAIRKDHPLNDQLPVNLVIEDLAA